MIKRTLLLEFENIRKTGKIAITLKEDDQLISVKKTNGDSEILMGTSDGRMVRFDEKEVRVMGRTAAGVKGIEVSNSKCVGCETGTSDQEILVVTENGYGKRTKINEYRMTHRGSKGVKTLNITEKNGIIVAFKTVYGDEELMITTNHGIIIRIFLEQVSQTGRIAQGVRLINLRDQQRVSTIALIIKEDEVSSK